MKNAIRMSFIDHIILSVDNALQTVVGKPRGSGRPDPADRQTENALSDSERKRSEGLMRVNHAGEVSAQALYQGQALVARDATVRASLSQSAIEENDHLLWCEQRLADLGGHKSYLSAFWYAGSFTTGVIAGLAGDKWSLGFVVETEYQVVKHLDEHLESLPAQDEKSRAVLVQMKEDELHHATVAQQAGAVELPGPIKKAMTLQSKVMTSVAYWI